MYLGQIYKKNPNLQNKPSNKFYFLDAIKEFINFVAMLALVNRGATLVAYSKHLKKRLS